MFAPGSRLQFIFLQNRDDASGFQIVTEYIIRPLIDSQILKHGIAHERGVVSQKGAGDLDLQICAVLAAIDPQ